MCWMKCTFAFSTILICIFSFCLSSNSQFFSHTYKTRVTCCNHFGSCTHLEVKSSWDFTRFFIVYNHMRIEHVIYEYIKVNAPAQSSSFSLFHPVVLMTVTTFQNLMSHHWAISEPSSSSELPSVWFCSIRPTMASSWITIAFPPFTTVYAIQELDASRFQLILHCWNDQNLSLRAICIVSHVEKWLIWNTS